MYRYAIKGHRQPFLTVADGIHHRFPQYFRPIKSNPRVNILDANRINDLTVNLDPALRRKALSLPDKIYEVLRMQGFAGVHAPFVGLDYFEHSLAVVLDAPDVWSEREFAYESLEAVIGDDINEARYPRIDIGVLVNDPPAKVRTQLIDYAAEMSGLHFPEDRYVALGGLSLSHRQAA